MGRALGDRSRGVRAPALRRLTAATVSLRPASAVPQGKTYRERKVHGRTIHFGVERDENGGSCGGESTFTGWERCGHRVLLYEQIISDECGGDFGFVWLVIEGTDAACGR